MPFGMLLPGHTLGQTFKCCVGGADDRAAFGASGGKRRSIPLRSVRIANTGMLCTVRQSGLLASYPVVGIAPPIRCGGGGGGVGSLRRSADFGDGPGIQQSGFPDRNRGDNSAYLRGTPLKWSSA